MLYHYRYYNLVSFMLVVGIGLTGCATADQDEQTQEPATSTEQLDALDRGIRAHGGMGQWQSFGTLEFDLVQEEKQEHHIVDMINRSVRVEGSTYTIGHDGTDAWVKTVGEDYRGSARFYSSLYFYFFGIPFVLADPGTHREYLSPLDVDGISYDRVKISYDAGVGESPDDYYIGHFNSETGLLDFVTYTVTYRSQEPSDNFSAQRFVEWQSVDGLRVPLQMDSYHWEEESETFGDQRAQTRYENIVFSTARPDQTIFEVPDGGVIDPRN